ncbi:2-phosphosulfolactate phosphatase [Streptomyces griseoincarnatus]
MRTHFLGIAEVTDVPDVAVVVDVMRAYTVAAWAFARGAERVVLAESLEDALAQKTRHPDWVTLKDGPAAPGFDLVNSPALLRNTDLSGRTVVQKTTAGTVGALAVKDAPLVLCASFVVAEATAGLLRERAPREVTFVVTGGSGRAEEDLTCAEYIAGRAGGDAVNADPYLRRAAASRSAAELTQGVREGASPEDVALCLELDRFRFAMAATVEGSLMVLRQVTPTDSPSP